MGCRRAGWEAPRSCWQAWRSGRWGPCLRRQPPTSACLRCAPPALLYALAALRLPAGLPAPAGLQRGGLCPVVAVCMSQALRQVRWSVLDGPGHADAHAWVW